MSEIARFHRAELIVPRSARGYGNDEFLFFQWDPSIDKTQFRVLLEDLAGRWVNLGNLDKKILIPNTYFPEKAMLVVVGRNRHGDQVRYLDELRRGHFYVLSSSAAGDHPMGRFIPQHRTY